MSNRINVGSLAFAIGAVLASGAAFAQAASRPVPTIHDSVDESKLVVLAGNTHPAANAENDRGIVPDSFLLDHMLLQLQRSPESEAALKQFIDDLHNPQSASFHRWLTPEEFAAQFGVAEQDVEVVTSWLKSKGFTVHGVQPSGLVVDFSGTAGQVRNAYHTEIHNLEVNGVKHIANMSDPRIPAALRPAVEGIVSLHDFRPQPLLVPRRKYTFTNQNGTVYPLVPGDIATIYNIKPAFAAGYTGAGQTIMVLEDTYLYSINDFAVFRHKFGLDSAYPSGGVYQVSPVGAGNCINPGFQGLPTDPGYGDDAEAALDVEWATATAPNATILLAACKDTSVTFGGLLALENILNGKSLPSVVSISYGEAETYLGAAGNLAYSLAYQQAVAEGVSIFVSSGDEGAASADFGNPSRHGITVSGFTSTPYNVSVGGLDFGYVANGINPGVYWNPNNSTAPAMLYSSALSYIQEVPWNDSCAGGLLSGFLGISPLGLCNNAAVTSPSGPLNFFLNAVGGSGGPSACATGSPSSFGIVGGSCAGYPKPAWQQGLVGNPGDGVRDIPDVSLFAANGVWGSYYVACWSNPDPNVGGGFTCSGAPGNWAGFGGTSISSPIMAGIQALINEKTKSRWGNPNTVYYSLAKSEYGAAGSPTCNSTTVNPTGNGCVFYDVTQGDNVVVCKANGTALNNCFLPPGYGLTYGILSTSNTAYQPAYTTNTGWDFPSGIGSVNVWNLLNNWP